MFRFLFSVCLEFLLSFCIVIIVVVSYRSRLAKMLHRLFEDGNRHVEVFRTVARISNRRIRSLEEVTLLTIKELRLISKADCIREVLRHCVFRYVLRIERLFWTRGQDFAVTEEFLDILQVLQDYEHGDSKNRTDHRWMPLDRYIEMYKTYSKARPWVESTETGEYFDDIDEKHGLLLHKNKVYLNQLLDRCYLPPTQNIPTSRDIPSAEAGWSEEELSLLDEIQGYMDQNVDLDRRAVISQSTLKGFLGPTQQQQQPERRVEMMDTDNLPSISMKPHPGWHGGYDDHQGFQRYVDFLNHGQNRQVSGVDVRQGGWDESRRDRRHQRDFDDTYQSRDDSRRDGRQRDFDDRNAYQS